MGYPDQKAPIRRLGKIDAENEIRLLKLSPGKFGCPLSGSLSVHSLKCGPSDIHHRSRRSIKYHALSYAWGSWAPRCSFHIDDGPVIDITQNLWTALQHLRHRHRSQYLWADQICIDQQDTSERNRQVKLIGDIYRHADQVLVWLGVAPVATKRQRLALLLGGRDDMVVRMANDAQAAARVEWASRGWVVQEVMLSSRAPVLCVGGSRIAYNSLGRKCFLQYGRYGGFHFRHWRRIVNVLQHRDQLTRVDSLLGLSELLLYTETQNPRDKIYSLLALMVGRLRDLIEVDYGRSVPQVFAYATWAHIVSCRHLAILLVPWPWIQQYGGTVRWPSWVPDYNNLRSDRVRFVREHYARENSELQGWDDEGWCRLLPYSEAVVKFNPKEETLSVRGLEFDHIVATSSMSNDDWRRMFAASDTRARLLPASERYRGVPQGPSPYDTLIQAHASCTSVRDTIWRPYLADIRLTRGASDRQTDVQHAPHTSSDGDAQSCRRARHPSIFDIFQQWRSLCRPERFGGPERPSWWQEDRFVSTLEAWLKYMDPHGACTRMFLTARGFLGVGPASVGPRDRIALLYGSAQPMALCPLHAPAPAPDRFRLAGAVYVHGIMDGELWEMPDFRLPERDFVLE